MVLHSVFVQKKKMNVISSPITTDVHPPPPTHTHAWFISSICFSPWALLAIEVNVLLSTIFKQRSKSCKLLYQYLKRHNSGIQLLSVAICYCTLIILLVVPEVFICEYWIYSSTHWIYFFTSVWFFPDNMWYGTLSWDTMWHMWRTSYWNKQ